MEDPVPHAVNAFFADFLQFNRHPDCPRGPIELLYPLYKGARHDSLLFFATSSVALATVGSAHRKHDYYKLGYAMFGRALQKTKLAVEDPVLSVEDETLMAVLLLGLFEVRVVSLSATVSNRSSSG